MTENTITGLRLHQWGVEAVAAQGTLTVETQPEAAHEFVVGAQTYAFVASGANAPGEINVGADLPAAKINTVAALNGTDGWNTPNPAAYALDFAGDDCVITARVPGPAGNSIVFTEALTGSGNVVDGAGTLGATTPGAFARGTAVAATSKIVIQRMEWGDDDENMHRPSFANGLLMRNNGQATAVQHGSRFSFNDEPAVYEQIMHWLSMAVDGEPTITFETGGAVDVFKWVFTRNPATNPNLQSWTIERQFDNGLGDTVEQAIHYSMLREIGMSWARNEHLRMSGGGFARRRQTEAITNSLTAPAAQIGVSALSTVDVDSSWANLGNTLLAEQVVGWNWRMGTGAMGLHTAEGRADLDFTKHQFDARNILSELSLTALLDPTTYAAELAASEAGTLRAVRVNAPGLGGRNIYIDALLTHEKPGLFKVGEQDGQDIVEMDLVETKDGTNFLAVTVEHPSVGLLT
jgi:hypothetical protein